MPGSGQLSYTYTKSFDNSQTCKLLSSGGSNIGPLVHQVAHREQEQAYLVRI